MIKNRIKSLIAIVMVTVVTVVSVPVLCGSGISNADTTPNYLTFTSVREEGSSEVGFNFDTSSYNCQYRFGTSGEWHDFPGKDQYVELNKGESIQLKAEKLTTSSDRHFDIKGDVEVSGSVTSLTDGNGGNPNVKLTNSCYESMFQFCSISTAPELPATTLAESCYENMFTGTNIKSSPALPATVVPDYAYMNMFTACVELGTIQEISATSLGKSACWDMFYNCFSITTVPELHFTDLSYQSCMNMFNDCDSLTTANIVLPATELAVNCYMGMFAGCEKLKTAPVIAATSLAESCCENMFSGCSSLTAAPKLYSTKLAKNCYKGMFQGCTSLNSIQVLPATQLKEGCYSSMFAGCTGINVSALKSGDNQYGWSIPSDATSADKWNDNMLAGTSGCFNTSGNPEIGTRYYLTAATVTFDSLGGSEVSNQIVDKTNPKISEPTSPTKDAYAFGGWYKDKSCTAEWDFNAEVKDCIILYAKWNDLTDLEKMVVELKKKIETLKDDVSKLQDKNSKLQDTISELLKKNEDLQADNDKLNDEISTLKKNILDLENSNTELINTIKVLKVKIKSQQEEIASLEKSNNQKDIQIAILEFEAHKMKITSAKAKKNAISLKYSMVSDAEGYQIYYKDKQADKAEYATASESSYKLKELKSEHTYRVKVRAYKTIAGHTVYSRWSPAKKIQVK